MLLGEKIRFKKYQFNKINNNKKSDYMQFDEEFKNNLKKHLDYSDEDLKVFMENPSNIELLSNAPKVLNKTIVIEVVESHGCNSQHKVSDKLYFDGVGNLLTKLSPKKICSSALSAVEKLIFAASQLLYADVDPNKMLIKRVGCSDIGLKCGGWGKIVMELRVQDR